MMNTMASLFAPANRRTCHTNLQNVVRYLSMAAAERVPTPRTSGPDVISIAPMMEVTDIFYRNFMRILTKRTKLYTEMVVDNTVLHTDSLDWHLRFTEEERPVALQMGGSDPEMLEEAVQKILAAGYAYDEIDLNCGCPSDRVATKSCFGARLMKDADRVSRVVTALNRATEGTAIDVTVKCRLGADDMDSYDEFSGFIRTVEQAGCKHFIVHARKCWLNGLNPKQNRTIPHLKYHWVYRAACEFPHLRISLNGGLNEWEEWEAALSAERLPQEVTPLRQDVLGAYPSTQAAEPMPGKVTPKTCEKLQVAEDPAQYGQGSLWRHKAPGDAFARGGLLDSIMVGRAAWHHPWRFADVDRRLFGDSNPTAHRLEAITKYLDWLEQVHAAGWKLPSSNVLVKPIVALFSGVHGGKHWRRAVVEGVRDVTPTGIRAVVTDALQHIPQDALMLPPHEDYVHPSASRAHDSGP